MRLRGLIRVAGMMSLTVVGACGGESGPGGDLSEQEQDALFGALNDAGVFLRGTPLALWAHIEQDPELGTLGTYSASGLQAIIRVDQPGTAADETTVMSGVLAWSGFNAGAGTVEEALYAAAFSNSEVFPDGIDHEPILGIPGPGAYGGYFERATNDQYEAFEGQFTLDAASFGPESPCEDLLPLTGAATTCTISTGTMRGNFDFVGFADSGPDFTQPNIAFDVPAARITLTIRYTTPQ